MIADVVAKYVLVGHSERRQYHQESSELVARKFVAAKAAGLVPILCVGETLEQREAGQTEYVLSGQLGPVFELAGPRALDGAVVAYEPIWAIGTGRTATPEQAQAVHAFIRGEAAARDATIAGRSEEHTSELQSLMRISYAVFCLKKKNKENNNTRQQYRLNTYTHYHE